MERELNYLNNGEVFKSGLGTVVIENPIRRADGQFVPIDTIKEVSNYCKVNGIKLHLDGARIHLASATTNISLKEYSSYFDTIYISLYKYLNAAGGAILCGDEKHINQVPHQIKIHGGTPFVRRRNFIENQKMQMRLAPITLTHLGSFGVSDDEELKLEFFFYSMEQDKADALAKELREREYEEETVESGDNNLLLVTGWTTKMKTDDKTVERWTEDMCELGYRNDCEFDGWGTTPTQD